MDVQLEDVKKAFCDAFPLIAETLDESCLAYICMLVCSKEDVGVIVSVLRDMDVFDMGAADIERFAALLEDKTPRKDAVMETPCSEVSMEENMRTYAPGSAVEHGWKEKIMERYFLERPTSSAARVVPHADNEQTKKVRYLDGKVVTTKGEKTVVVGGEEGPEMKKTYIYLKAAKKYRFH